MSRWTKWIVAAGIAAVLAGGASAADEKLLLKKARIRRGRADGVLRLRVRAQLPDPATYASFDPRFQPIDLFVNGREILCVPGWSEFEEPDPLYPGWSLNQRTRDRWIYTSPDREIRLDLERGIVTVEAEGARLVDLVEAGATDVKVTLQLGVEVVETLVDVHGTDGSWRLVPASASK